MFSFKYIQTDVCGLVASMYAVLHVRALGTCGL